MTPSKDEKPAAPFYASVSDYIRDPSAWQDFDQIDINLLDGAEIVIHDVMFLRGDFDKPDPDYAIILFAKPEDGIAAEKVAGRDVPENAKTTASGGAVFVRKMKELAAVGPEHEGQRVRLPVKGTIVLRKSDRYPKPYVDFV